MTLSRGALLVSLGLLTVVVHQSISSTPPSPQPEPVIRAAAPRANAASANAAQLETAPELTPTEKARNDTIIMDLQDQRLRALAPQLHPWVRYQFLAFETHDDKGRALDRSVGWGVGWYNGEKFHWFAYTSPDGWLQVNMSLRMSKKDMDEMSAGGRLDARGALEHDIPGTATHVAFSDGGMTWVHEFCIKDSSVCNTAGALEKYLLANADKAMPDRILFYTRGYFPY